MTVALACLVTLAVLYYILSVRAKDLPQPEPVSPFHHLDERKASIYENLRDLQFEFRVGKMSELDYQQAKTDLQKELAGVLAEIDRLKTQLGAKVSMTAKPASAPMKKSDRFVCPHCKAEFPKAMKFCGECGKPMGEGRE